MATIVHDYGLQRIAQWDTPIDVRALLLKSTAVPTKQMQFVSSLVAGSVEISVTGYARVALTGESTGESTDVTNHWHKITADTITFSGMSGTDQTAGFLALFEFNASDAAALCLVTYDIADILVGATNPSVSWSLPTNGIRYAQKGVL